MVVTAATTLREATGDTIPVWNSTSHSYIVNSTCVVDGTCRAGLSHDYMIMTEQGVWAPLIIMGIFATTLSSASGCLIGAPRILQALCEDKLFPYIHTF